MLPELEERFAREGHPPDPLSEILDSLVLQSWVPGPLQLKAPWGVEVPTRWGWFYLAGGRPCAIEVAGLDAALPVAAGDLVVLPQGRAHRLGDAPGRPTVPIQEWLMPLAADHVGPVASDVSPTATHLFCGCFRQDRLNHGFWSAALPPVMHIKGEGGQPPAWVAALVQLIGHEAASTEAVARLAVNHLVRVLLLKVVSRHVAALPADSAHWLQALADPEISRALELMHGDPAAPWTVAALAARLEMARSTFAARFARLVGQPPLEYLTQWRMQKAGAMLRTAHVEVKEVAAQVGYRSAAAFSKTFARWAGASPGTYRRSGPARNEPGEPGTAERR